MAGLAARSLTLALCALLLAPVPFASGSLWPAQPSCERPVDEPGLVVQVCVGGSICYAVGGTTHVFVCLDPSFCPPPMDDGELPSDVCRDSTDLDADGDGWTVAQGDCDDSDPFTNPDAQEQPYDGIDNDCNGVADTDADSDGDGWTVGQGDCDDYDPGTNPGQPEYPGDGFDNDCDGQVDEN